MHSTFGKLKADHSSPHDSSPFIRSIESGLRNGTFSGEVWTEDWKPLFRRWLPGAEIQIKRRVLDVDAFAGFIDSFEECWRIVGTAELLQCITGESDTSIGAIVEVFARNRIISKGTAQSLREEVSAHARPYSHCTDGFFLATGGLGCAVE